LHGQSGTIPPPPLEEELTLSRFLAHEFEKWEPFLEYLKKLSDGTFSYEAYWEPFLKACEKAGIVRILPNNSFTMRKSRFLKQNDWLEALAFAACRDAGCDDVQWKIPVTGITTDFDVVATYGAIMLVCSCKSGDFKNSHLDELDAQSRLVGGLFCRRAILLKEATEFSRRRNTGVNQARA